VNAGIVLSAGSGTRFGTSTSTTSKLLAELGGRPLLEHAVSAQCAVAELERVVVVLGASADEVRARVELGRAEVVVCERWADGQSASLQCGVAALRDADTVIVTLGDAPLITPEVIRLFLDQPGGTRATYDGCPGHPVVLGPDELAAVSGLHGDEGARGLLSGARTIECGALGSGIDVDTPEQLGTARELLSRELRLPGERQQR
jgi:CTP:molybdopterin cytidylyltransferase MocA